MGFAMSCTEVGSSRLGLPSAFDTGPQREITRLPGPFSAVGVHAHLRSWTARVCQSVQL